MAGGPSVMATINGTSGDDRLFGTPVDDIINGLGRQDVLQGGGGADRLDGGDGIDLATYIESGVGVSVNLATGIGLFGSAQGDQLFNIEYLVGSDHNDTLTGNDGNNDMAGRRGND